jgi:hypothetical protein
MKFILILLSAAAITACAPMTPQDVAKWNDIGNRVQPVFDAAAQAAQQRNEARINKSCWRSAVTGQMIGDPKYCGY